MRDMAGNANQASTPLLFLTLPTAPTTPTVVLSTPCLLTARTVVEVAFTWGIPVGGGELNRDDVVYDRPRPRPATYRSRSLSLERMSDALSLPISTNLSFSLSISPAHSLTLTLTRHI